VKFLAEHPTEAEMYKSQVALGYFGDPFADIGPVAVFLASAEAHYLTGQTINADGGQQML
jgi:NAD(P)-dependent dehydrogenase (short-subunit alcohol dehydrogenase family)